MSLQVCYVVSALRLSLYFEPPKDKRQGDEDDKEAYPAREITPGQFNQTDGEEDDGRSPSKSANTPSHFAETNLAVTIFLSSTVMTTFPVFCPVSTYL